MRRRRYKKRIIQQSTRDIRESRIYLCELCLKTYDTGTGLRNHKALHTNKSFEKAPKRKMENAQHLVSDRLCKLEKLESFKLLRALLQNGLKSKLMTLLDRKLTMQFISNSKNNEGRLKWENLDTIKPTKRLVDSNDKKKKYKFSCAECGRQFLSKAALKIHLNSHFGIKAFKCPKCGLRLSQKGGLTVHMRIHTGEKPFKCKFCGRAFTQPVSRGHMSIHTGEKLHKCDICCAAFGSSTVLKTHKISKHSLLRPYQCDICKKDFADKDYMKKHRTIHRNVRPYPCTKCDKSYITKSCLTRHLVTHTDQRPYECTVCQKSYNNSGAFVYHMTTHTGHRKYICGICDQELSTKQNLEGHMKIHARLKTNKL